MGCTLVRGVSDQLPAVEEMMQERGVEVDHSSLNRWVLKYTPELDKAFRQCKRLVGNSWRMDETYINVKEKWKYLYRAVDKFERQWIFS
jgi:transposase-like protein